MRIVPGQTVRSEGSKGIQAKRVQFGVNVNRKIGMANFQTDSYDLLRNLIGKLHMGD